jgi:DNA repair protein RadC
MKIKEMCSEERPREKMLSKGPEALSNAELLAILLGSGTKDMNAVEVAQTLLSKAGGSMLNLARMSVEKLCEISGIGQKKAVSIKAAMELGKKFALEKPDQELKSIISSEMAYEIMLPTMIGLDHEECWVMYLNRANYLIKKEKASSGGLTATVIDTKEVVRKALEAQASGIILFHNHPSGNPRPGKTTFIRPRS